jgi:formate dehydrogenase (NADP+) beta subunit
MTIPHSNDRTVPADLHDHAQGTGPDRRRIPNYINRLPPCNAACPAGENIQAWLALAQAGDYEGAWRRLVEDNPMPSVHGRVCYHPCESACNRQDLDQTVSIHALERFLGDLALEKQWTLPTPVRSSGKRVLIVGAGPSGLSAAYHLTRMGHQVEIFEAGPVAGGMLHFGIPAYRLPRDELAHEVARIEAMGVLIHLNRKVDDVILDMQQGKFDAAFVAIGAHLSKRIDIPTRDTGRILDAVSFLRGAKDQPETMIGRRVAVYGGGNTAMDAARTALRLGATETCIIYRRDRDHMPAHSFEADEALSEGVRINWLRTIREMNEGLIEVEVMQVDESGRPQPTGTFETLNVDTLILALGQDTESGFLQKIPEIVFRPDGVVEVDHGMMTGRPGIFAGGDMVPSERTVTVAVGHGKKAARHIDAWLEGKRYEKAKGIANIALKDLKVWYATDNHQVAQKSLKPTARTQDFREVVAGLTDSEALYEAKRCLSCGNCFECDGCFGACPEKAIQKQGIGRGYRVDVNRCTGCAVCEEQCPCHAITMQSVLGDQHV